MKAATPQLIEFLNAVRASKDGLVLMADCFLITTMAGLTLAYTNIEVPVVINGLVYVANSVLVNGLKYKSEVGLSVDEQQITIEALPTETVGGIPLMQAIQNGLFDGAEVVRQRAFLNSFALIDAANPIGSVILFKGRVGAVDSIGRTTAQITVNSDLVLLDVDMPRNLYSPNCQHALFDSGCTLLKANFTTNGSVGAGSTFSVINWSGALPAFAQGSIVFLSGPNTGTTANVKSATNTQLALSFPLLNQPTAGDTFQVSQGCDHSFSTCQNKFNNLVNFRGFPFVPPPSFAL
ncbi:MAG: DUF2163 domain-containing protein [Methylocella sp.]